MNLDYKLFALINNIAGHNKIFDTLMVDFTKYAVLIYGVVLLFYWFKPGVNNKKFVLKAVTSALFGLGINQIVGFIYFRPRPFAHHAVNLLVDKSIDPSFPSDHATGSSALTVSLFQANKLVGLVLFVVTVLLMVSRIYVGTHYPSDVVGGFITGVIGCMLSEFLWLQLDANKFIKIYNKYIPI